MPNSRHNEAMQRLAKRNEEVHMWITHPFCPCCGKKIPLHFLWTAGLHARHCPCCDKNIRLRRPKTFGLGFIAVTLSWLPGQTATGHPLLATLAIAIALFGGLAL